MRLVLNRTTVKSSWRLKKWTPPLCSYLWCFCYAGFNSLLWHLLHKCTTLWIRFMADERVSKLNMYLPELIKGRTLTKLHTWIFLGLWVSDTFVTQTLSCFYFMQLNSPTAFVVYCQMRNGLILNGMLGRVSRTVVLPYRYCSSWP
jgi:hypothetical protein